MIIKPENRRLFLEIVRVLHSHQEEGIRNNTSSIHKRAQGRWLGGLLKPTLPEETMPGHSHTDFHLWFLRQPPSLRHTGGSRPPAKVILLHREGTHGLGRGDGRRERGGIGLQKVGEMPRRANSRSRGNAKDTEEVVLAKRSVFIMRQMNPEATLYQKAD